MRSSRPSAKELSVGQLICIAEADSKICVMYADAVHAAETLKRTEIRFYSSNFGKIFIRTVSSSELYGTVLYQVGVIDLALFSPRKIESISSKLNFFRLSRPGILLYIRHYPII